jgi:hypothetical protein
MSYNAQNINSKIEIIQHNTARKIPVMHSCLEIAFKANIDFILMQEPWIANDNKGTVSHPAYIGILPPRKEGIRPRVAIFARKNTPYSYTARPDISSNSNILILQVSGPGISPFQLINIYNEKGLGEDREWTIKRSLQTIKPEKRSIVCGDFNAHHSWWNSRISNPIRCSELIPWLERFNFELKNIEDLATFHRSNTENASIIDLTFATIAIESKVDNWYIDEEAYTGSDHEVIRFSINKDSENNPINSIKQERYNLDKANWEKFKESILGEYTELAQKFQDLTTESQLDSAAKSLELAIQKAADIAIPKRNISYHSKPWWNDEIDKSRERLSQKRRVWKRIRDTQNHKAFLSERNKYFSIIKTAKQGL